MSTDSATALARARETEAACGWRHPVITGWRLHVLSGLDALSAQRRPPRRRIGYADGRVRRQ
ncbi:hypothetical protein AB0L75_28115 [Streptomyces sp. NPDC052101]|uniref:hypothetical protein n=1 Tax=Streptomyces sp. NPDC052101 TaxID=3155763 RepID=UPI0034351195